MVAIVAGGGLGLFNTSLNSLGGVGQPGSSKLGGTTGTGYVNAATGNLILQSLDEQLSGRGADLFHLRSYNAQGQLNDGDADGWRWEGERKVVLTSGTVNTSGSTVTRTGADGHTTAFTWDATRNAYVSAEGAGAHDTLVATLDTNGNVTVWTYTEGSSRTVESYDGTSGRLASVTDSSGNSLTYSYNGSGQLSSVLDSATNQELVLVYDGNGRLERLDTRTQGGSAVRQVYYSYDSSGRLTSVTTDLTPADNSISDGATYVTSYTYDGTSFRIASISQSDGTSASFTYVQVGSDYRIETVTDNSGTTTFSYDTTNRETTVTTATGQAWKYVYDTANRLTEVRTPAVNGQVLVTSYSYDTDGNVTSVTDGRGNVVSYQYDSNGNQVLERDALGNTVERTYNAANQLQNLIQYTSPATWNSGTSTWTNPSASTALVTRYAYDSSNRLRFSVSADGRVTEYRYNSAGLRAAEIHFSGASYDTSSLALTDTLSESTLSTWSGNQSASATTLTSYEYDARGDLSKTTVFASTSAVGTGTVDSGATITEFVYSAHGQLLQTIAVRGSARDQLTTLSSRVYDGLGRLTSEVGSSGTTSYVYGVNGSGQGTVAVTGQSGLTTTQTFDSRGRLISLLQAATGETSRSVSYVYDTAGRLRMTEDAVGARSYLFYDTAERLSAKVDATGAVVEYVYNANGQVTSEIRYATQVDTGSWFSAGSVTVSSVAAIRPATHADDRTVSSTYDNANRLATTTDAGGLVTTYSYDGADRLVQVTAGSGSSARTSRSFYGNDGQLLATLDGEGYLVEHSYNAAGQKIKTIRYADDTDSSLRATGTLDQLRGSITASSTNDLVSYSFYDQSGRLIGSVDEQQFVTAYSYDEAGNQQSVTRYGTAYTSTISSATSFSTIQSAVSSGSSQTSTTTFDSFGRVSTRTNAEGTVTAFEYDSAGRLVKETTAQGTSEARSTRTQYNAFGDVKRRLSAEQVALVESAGMGGLSLDDLVTVFATYGLRFAFEAAYDAAGRQVRVTDQAGNTGIFYYDANGRLTHAVNGAGEVSETEYNTFGEVQKTTAFQNRLDPADYQAEAASGGGLNTSITALANAIRNVTFDSTSTVTYNSRGLIATRTDAEGYVTSYIYNDFGQLQSETRTISSGNTITTTYAYNRRGELTDKILDPTGLNLTRNTQYDAFGRIKQQTDALNKITTLNYLDKGRIIAATDPLTRERRTEYDAFGRTLKVTDALGKITSYSYDDTARKVTVTTPEGISTSTTRTRHGEVLTVTDGNGNQSQYTYNKNGELLTVQNDQDIITTTNVYNILTGRLDKTTDARGGEIRYEYDAANRVLIRTNSKTGGQTTYQYDGQGRVTETGEYGSLNPKVTRYEYDRKGQVLKVKTDPESLMLVTTYEYDGVGQQVKVSRGSNSAPAQQVTSYAFDKAGRRTSETQDPTGLALTTQYRYDAEGRLTRKIDAGNNSTWYVYNDAGVMTHSINALGAVTAYGYDAENRVTVTTQYATALSTATVAGFGDIVSSVSPTANTAQDQLTRTVYDQDGRARFAIDSLNGVSERVYDDAGNVIAQKRYTDALASLPATLDVPSLQAALAGKAAVATQQVYNELNQQRFEIDALGYVTEWEYDLAGSVTAKKRYQSVLTALPSPLTADNLEAALTDPVTGIASTATHYVYDPAGRLIYTVDALNYVSENIYDNGSQLTGTVRYLDKLPAGTALTLADIANVTSLANAPRDTTIYRYDGAGRLYETEHIGDGAQAWMREERSYDAVGNVIRERRYGYNGHPNVEQEANTYHFYDAAGRQRYSVDALLNVTERQYSTTGQVIAEVRYGEPLNALPATFADLEVALGAITEKVTTRYVRDQLGRLRFTIDALWQVTENRYDAQGALVETRKYLNSIPSTTLLTLTGVYAAVVAENPVEEPPPAEEPPAEPPELPAQTFPVAYGSGEIVVNNFATGDQRRPSVAALSTGGSVVVWESIGQDGSGAGIYAQRFDANGNKVGGEIHISINSTTGDQSFLASGIGQGSNVAALPNGGFVVTWMSSGQIHVGIFRADGTLDRSLVPSSFLSGSSQHSHPSVSVQPSGDFVVAWQAVASGGIGKDVYVQRFSQSGGKRGDPIRVNTNLGSVSGNQDDQLRPVVTGLTNGTFVVTYVSEVSGSSLWGQVIGDSGIKIGSEFQVNTLQPGMLDYVTNISLGTDGFVSVWRVLKADGSVDIYGQRFSNTGLKLDVEFKVNTSVAAGNELPAVAALATGGFTVSFSALNQDGSGSSVVTQRYDAQGGAIEGLLRLNTTTNDDQGSVAIRKLNNGTHMAVWTSAGQDGSGQGVFARVIDFAGSVSTPPSGVPLSAGGEVQVNTTAVGGNSRPIVVALQGGGSVVLWASGSQEIIAQRYDAGGQRVGTEFRINATTAGSQDFLGHYGAAAALPDGGFVVTWTGTGNGSDIFVRRFTASGEAVEAGDVLVNTTAAGSQQNASVTVLANGDYVVTWQAPLQTGGSGDDIYFQRFSAAGAKLGGEVRANTATAGNQSRPVASALANGGFIVSYCTPDSRILHAQIFNSAGATVGSAFQINSMLHAATNDVMTVELANGDLVAVWRATNHEVYGQRFTAAGVKKGPEFLINLMEDSDEFRPVVTALPDGGFVVAYSGQQGGGSVSAVLAQRYDANGAPMGEPLQLNVQNSEDPFPPAMALLANGKLLVAWKAEGRDVDVPAIYARLLNVGQGTEEPGEEEPTPTSPTLPVSDNLQQTRYVYDKLGRLRFTIDSLGHVTESLYNAQGQMTETRRYQNTIGNKLSTESALTVFYTNASAAAEPRIVTNYVFDALGRQRFVLSSPIDGARLVKEYLYDALGNLTSETQYAESIPADTALSEAAVTAAVTQAHSLTPGASAVLLAGGANEFQVNSGSMSDQQRPSVATLTDGGSVVVWESVTGSRNSIFAQRYDASGNKVDSAIEVESNERVGFYGHGGAVAALNDGGFVVTWASEGDSGDVFMRCFDANGSTRTGRIKVNDADGGEKQQRYSSVTKLSNGEFIIAWQTMGNGALSVNFRRFSATGSKLGNEVVLTPAGGVGEKPVVTALSSGGFVMTYLSMTATGTQVLRGQIFSALGAPVGAEFQLNNTQAGALSNLANVALAGGGFISTWIAANASGGYDVYGQRFNNSGAVVGSEFKVNSTLSAGNDLPALAAFADGSFAVAYTAVSQDGSGKSVVAQRFSSAGAAVGQAQRLNSTTASDQRNVALLAKSGNSLFALWESYGQDGDGLGIVGRIVDLTLGGVLPTPPVIDPPRVTSYVYGETGRLRFTIDALKQVSERTYDALGRVVVEKRYTSPLTLTAPYTEEGVATAVATMTAVTTSYVYDTLGQMRYVVDPMGYVTERGYDNLGNQILEKSFALAIDLTGISIPTEADISSRLVTNVKDIANRAEFDAEGRKTASIDSNNNRIEYRHDAHGNVVEITDQRGNKGYFYFDALNRNVASIDPEGYLIERDYDGFGRLQTTTKYANQVVGAVDADTRPAVVTTSQSGVYLLADAGKDAVTTYVYDELDRMVKQTDAEGNFEVYGYDNFGNRNYFRNKLGGEFSYTFDVLGRQLTERLPELSGTQAVINKFSYDTLGNLTTKTEAVGLVEQRVTTFQYDLLGRQTRKISETVQGYVYSSSAALVSLTPTELTEYDSRGNVILQVNANGAKTFSYYDDRNLKVAEVNAVGVLTEWDYDAAGNKSAFRIYDTAVALPTQAGGVVPAPGANNSAREILFSYDKLGRKTGTELRGIKIVDGVAIALKATVYDDFADGTGYGLADVFIKTETRYDQAGNVVAEKDGRGNTAYNFYDKSGRKVLSVDREGYAITWTYGANTRTEHRYANVLNANITENSNLNDVLQALAPSADDRIIETDFDRLGRVKEERLLNVEYGSVNTSNGQLTTAFGTSVTSYERNGLDLVTKLTDANGAITVTTYDKQGREVTRQLGNYADYQGSAISQRIVTAYNGLDLVTKQTLLGTNDAVATDDRTVSYTYNKLGLRVAEVDALGNKTEYAYDAAGNQTLTWQKRTDAANTIYTDGTFISYDLLGREALRQVRTGPGIAPTTWSVVETRENRYNAYNEITGKRLNGGGTGGTWQETAEFNIQGKAWRTNSANGAVQFFVYDRNGNATLQLDSTGGDISGMTLESVSGVTYTETHYDKRNLVTDIIQPSSTQTVSQSKVQLFRQVVARSAALTGFTVIGDVTGRTVVDSEPARLRIHSLSAQTSRVFLSFVPSSAPDQLPAVIELYPAGTAGAYAVDWTLLPEGEYLFTYTARASDGAIVDSGQGVFNRAAGATDNGRYTGGSVTVNSVQSGNPVIPAAGVVEATHLASAELGISFNGVYEEVVQSRHRQSPLGPFVVSGIKQFRVSSVAVSLPALTGYGDGNYFAEITTGNQTYSSSEVSLTAGKALIHIVPGQVLTGSYTIKLFKKVGAVTMTVAESMRSLPAPTTWSHNAYSERDPYWNKDVGTVTVLTGGTLLHALSLPVYKQIHFKDVPASTTRLEVYYRASGVTSGDYAMVEAQQMSIGGQNQNGWYVADLQTLPEGEYEYKYVAYDSGNQAIGGGRGLIGWTNHAPVITNIAQINVSDLAQTAKAGTYGVQPGLLQGFRLDGSSMDVWRGVWTGPNQPIGGVIFVWSNFQVRIPNAKVVGLGHDGYIVTWERLDGTVVSTSDKYAISSATTTDVVVDSWNHQGQGRLKIYGTIGSHRVLLGSSGTLTAVQTESGQGATQFAGAASFLNLAKVSIKGQAGTASWVDFSYRPLGSSDPYSVQRIGRFLSASSSVIDNGWFSFDVSALTLNQQYEFKYFTVGANGVLNRRTGWFKVTSTGITFQDNAALIGGDGYTLFETGNKLNFIDQASANLAGDGKTAVLRVRKLGLVEWEPDIALSLRDATVAGWFSWNYGSRTGDYEYVLEVKNTGGGVVNKVTGEVSLGTVPKEIVYTPFALSPKVVTVATVGAQSITIRYGDAPGGSLQSVTLAADAEGKVLWDVSNVAVLNLTAIYYEYTAYSSTGGTGTVLNKAHGYVYVGPGGGRVEHVNDPRPTWVDIQTPYTNAVQMKLYYRHRSSDDIGQYADIDQWSIAEGFTLVTLSPDSQSRYRWDTSELVPESGYADYQYFYELYDAGGTRLSFTPGYIRVFANGEGTSEQLKRVIDGSATEQTRIHRRQQHNAFGEIVSETDGNGNITNLYYNTLGKLVEKQTPETEVTLKNGFVTLARPTTSYAYDKAGRLVATTDANGNRTTLALLNGIDLKTGQALIEHEFRADETTQSYKYDAFGQVKIKIDGLKLQTHYQYDLSGNLKSLTRPARVSDSASAYAGNLQDSYDYDEQGRRIRHTNALGYVDTTYYDSLDRVSKTVNAAGITTTISYVYDSGILGVGSQQVGGYRKTTTYTNGRTLIDEADYFGRVTKHTDLHPRVFTYEYDFAGRLHKQTGESGQNIEYEYYANGYLMAIKDYGLNNLSRYAYDNNGNRIVETYSNLNSIDGDPQIYQSANIAYDSLNRVKAVTDASFTLQYEYDANDNVRHVYATYSDGVNGSPKVQDYWYAYDHMNRFLITMGELSGGRGESATDMAGHEIVRGRTGVQIEYDDNGQRIAAIYGAGALGSTEDRAHREDYYYTSDGYLETVEMKRALSGTDESNLTQRGGTLTARRINDALGRTTTYLEYKNGAFSRKLISNYLNDNRLSSQSVDAVDNAKDSSTQFNYGNDDILDSTTTTTYTEEAGQTVQTTTYVYAWWDSAKQLTIKTQAANSNVQNWAPGWSRFEYDKNGHLSAMHDEAANRHQLYVNNAQGMVLSRNEIVEGEFKRYRNFFYLSGKRIGDLSNDGPSRVDYAQAMSNADKKFDPRNFKPISSADFDQNYEPISPDYPGGAAISYTVNSGDTLRSIALTVWGDEAMWYLIADANGLAESDSLTQGQVLVIPNKVTNIHNNSKTFRPYNPGEAMGDTQPTLPEPPPPSRKCNMLAIVIMVAVAVAAAIVVGPYVAGFVESALAAMSVPTAVAAGVGIVVGGAAAGAAGSVASQAAGKTLGVVDHFSWRQVGIAALTGGITAGVGLGLQGLAGVQGMNAAVATWLDRIGDALTATATGANNAALAANVGRSVLTSAAVGAVNYLGGYAANKLLGEDMHFSWNSMASAVVGNGLARGLQVSTAGELGNYAANIIGDSAAAAVDDKWFGGARPDYLSVAAHAIGDSLGNQIAGKIDGIRDKKAMSKLSPAGQLAFVEAKRHGATRDEAIMAGEDADNVAFDHFLSSEGLMDSVQDHQPVSRPMSTAETYFESLAESGWAFRTVSSGGASPSEDAQAFFLSVADHSGKLLDFSGQIKSDPLQYELALGLLREEGVNSELAPLLAEEIRNGMGLGRSIDPHKLPDNDPTLLADMVEKKALFARELALKGLNPEHQSFIPMINQLSSRELNAIQSGNFSEIPVFGSGLNIFRSPLENTLRVIAGAGLASNEAAFGLLKREANDRFLAQLGIFPQVAALQVTFEAIKAAANIDSLRKIVLKSGRNIHNPIVLNALAGAMTGAIQSEQALEGIMGKVLKRLPGAGKLIDKFNKRLTKSGEKEEAIAELVVKYSGVAKEVSSIDFNAIKNNSGWGLDLMIKTYQNDWVPLEFKARAVRVPNDLDLNSEQAKGADSYAKLQLNRAMNAQKHWAHTEENVSAEAKRILIEQGDKRFKGYVFAIDFANDRKRITTTPYRWIPKVTRSSGAIR